MTSSSKKRKSSRTTPKGQSTTFSPAKIAVFLENLRSYANVTEACKAAGLDRTSTYIKKQNDPNFAKAWADAYDKGIDAMEEEAHRRAVDGVKKGIFYKGRQVATERVYSDTLAIFMLKGARPEKYRERSEVTGKGGGPISFIVENSKDE